MLTQSARVFSAQGAISRLVPFCLPKCHFCQFRLSAGPSYHLTKLGSFPLPLPWPGCPFNSRHSSWVNCFWWIAISSPKLWVASNTGSSLLSSFASRSVAVSLTFLWGRPRGSSRCCAFVVVLAQQEVVAYCHGLLKVDVVCSAWWCFCFEFGLNLFYYSNLRFIIRTSMEIDIVT